jgi:hypothetical protein
MLIIHYPQGQIIRTTTNEPGQVPGFRLCDRVVQGGNAKNKVL